MKRKTRLKIVCKGKKYFGYTKTKHMYKKIKPNKTDLTVNKGYQGETIENKINRIVNNKEPIKDGAPLIYTDRQEGVQPQYDIRTDRFEIAVEAMEAVNKTQIAQRDHRIGERTYDTMTPDQQKEFNQKYPTNKHAIAEAKKNAGGESTQATDK